MNSLDSLNSTPFAAGHMSPARPRKTLFGVVQRRQTYLNMLYLLAIFPLGTLYFIFLLTTLGVSLSTLVGAVLALPLMMYVWRGLGRFERQLAIWWLGIDIAPFAQPLPSGLSFWQRQGARLRDRISWTSLLYLFVTFPFGLLTFVIGAVLITLTFALVVAPVGLIAQLVVDGPPTPDRMWVFYATPGFFILGLLVGLASLHVFNGLAWVWGHFAQFSLGMSDTEQRVAEARAAAARAEAVAARAEQSRRELIVNVSHELRTPIASIRGHVESLQIAMEDSADGRPPAEELHTYLGIVARESERLSALVEDLLALARAESGELRLDIRPVALDAVVVEVYEALAPLARRERQVTLVREVQSDLPPALADRQRLAQVLLNLVRNAITYTPAGGIVSIGVERVDAAHVAVVVADTGIGIPPAELAHVFERFYRADASRSRATGGSGLGLAIVRDLVVAMGGMVTADSQVGVGSRFRVMLQSLTTAHAEDTEHVETRQRGQR
jgi:signal transduction histidine kinase